MLVLALGTVLAGCSQPKESSSDNPKQEGKNGEKTVTNINFWGGWTGPDGDVMRTLVEQFNQENADIKVNLETLQWTPLFEKLITQTKVGNPPALMAMHPQDIAQFASLGVLDPDAAKGAGVEKDQFNANAWDGTFYDGKQYAIPLDMHMHALYLNNEMYEKAGLDPANPPKTGEELIDYATKLTIDANGKHPNETGFDINNVKQWGLGMPNNHHGFYLWFALLNQQNEKLLDDSGKKTAFKDDAGEKAWKWLGELVYKHHVVPAGQKAPMDDFKSGLTAMVIDGPWQLPGLEGQDALKWSTAAFPRIFATDAVWGSAHVLTFPKVKDAKEREAAVKLAKWIAEHSEAWAKSGNIPSNLTAQKGLDDLPGRKAFIEMMPYTKVLPNIPKTAQAFSASSPSPIMNASQGILLENKDPSAITKEMRDGLEAIISQP
ncbi:hypothetical protein AA980_18530 [Neobacillus vireti]|nr:hypothetical protein AA980_18530 [Neobacillus vireti]